MVDCTWGEQGIRSRHAVTAQPDHRVWIAQSDAWQAEGRLREPLGGGAVDLPGIRLMASGLPHAQWNNGDVIDAGLVRIDDVRAWYASRAAGRSVPWGVRVPAGMPFTHGRYVFTKRCMGLLPERFRPADVPSGVAIATAARLDLETVAEVDAAAFGDPIEQNRPWVEPHVEAAGFTVAVARIDNAIVGIATAILTDDLAGPCVGIFGVAVLESSRRRGIGTALVSWLIERAWAAGARLAHLNPDTDAACRLYARLGFVETAGLDVYGDL